MPSESRQRRDCRWRPKVAAEVRDLAREHTVDAVTTLVRIMNDPKEDGRTRVAAACALLDRGYGKPAQALELDGRMRMPTSITFVHDDCE